MEFLKARNNFGVGETKEIPCLTGKGAPAMSTAGDVGCLYMDADTGDVYKCTAVSGTTYTWVALVQNGNGWTTEQINLLDSLFNYIPWTSSEAGAIADSLIASLRSGSSGGSGDDSGGEIETTYAIVNALTNVTNNNTASVVTAGASYSATLTAAAGYELDTVTVTMGGVNVTSTAYAGGKITIAAVTGNVVITASARETVADGTVEVIALPDYCMVSANGVQLAYEVGTYSAYFACEPNTNYKVVEHGTHNRFRFLGIADDTFTPVNAYACDNVIANSITNPGIDSLTEITINSGSNKWIYVYLAADSSVSPNISVTEVE